MRFFTSDLHVSHINVIKYCNRPFDPTIEGVAEMNDALVDNWNRAVTDDDEVFVIGDFSLSYAAAVKVVPRLNGKKILIFGNHDLGHPAHKKSKTPEKQEKARQLYLEMGWAEVLLSKEVTLKNNSKARLYHLPYHEDAPEEGMPQNHPKWRLEDDGMLLLCGHVHNAWKHKFTLSKLTLMVNVGVDVWGLAPVSEDRLLEYIKNV